MKENKVIQNAKWIIICKVVQSVLQLIIGMLSARYLGPANYGLINYAKSVVAFVAPVTQLGLSATLVREFIDEPDKEGEILGTSLLMSAVSSILSIVLVSGFVSVANRGEAETLLVCFLYSLSLLFQTAELIQYWFHYKLQSKFHSAAILIAYFLVALYKVYLLASGKSVYWFAVAYAVEYAISGGLLFAVFWKQCQNKLRATMAMAGKLFSRSRYYILSSLMVTLFQNTDHVMLKIMAGDAENGIYTAAITCASIAGFVYSAIIDSYRPVILFNKKIRAAEYEDSISRVYCVITYLAVAQGVCFALFAKPIILILFGEEYAASIPVLQILIWYLAFSNMGRIRNIWILAENKQNILWKINMAGAVTNTVFNAAAIPLWGAAGAAFVSLLTQFFTNFLLGFIVSPLKENNKLLLKGIDPKNLIAILRKGIQSLRSAE